MALYPEEVISDIIAANDIVDVVSGYVSLKKSSGDYVGLCPFHQEKTPSFHISASKQLYHCFGCGEGGNVINFIMKVENLDFVETVKFLAERAGIALPEENYAVNDQNHQTRKRYYEMNKSAARFFYQNLMETSFGARVWQYIAKRGLSKKTVTRFGLGASGEHATDLYQHLSKEGYNLDDMVGAGLVMKNEKGVYDRFRGRMMFPIFDLRSNVIGFGGRVLDDSVPKYLNSPETLVFNKGRNIFGMNIAKNYVKDSLILVEGYMDVISLHQAGIPTTIASLGTALTEDQTKLIARYAKKVYVCYDSDEAGRKATLKAIEVFRSTKIKCMICDFTGEKDPDEIIKTKGSDAFFAILKKAESAVMYQINLEKRRYNLDDVEQKIGFVKACAAILAKLDNPIELEAYTKSVSDYCGLSQDSLIAEIRKILASSRPALANRYYRAKSVYNKKETELNANNSSKPNLTKNLLNAQKSLLGLIATRKDLYRQCKTHISPEEFVGNLCRETAKVIYELWESGIEPSPADVLQRLPGDLSKEAADLFFKPTIYTDYHAAVAELLWTIFYEKLSLKIASESDIIKKNELIKAQLKMREGGFYEYQ